MGTRIVVGGGSDMTASSVGFAAPVPNGLVGWFDLGGGSAQAITKDLAFIAAATLAGTPTFATGYTTFGNLASGQWLQTTVPETPDMTICVVFRSSDTMVTGHLPTVVSNVGPDTLNLAGVAGGRGLSIAARGFDNGGAGPGVNWNASAYVNNGGTLAVEQPIVDVVTNPGGWHFWALSVVAAGSVATLYDMTDGTQASASSSYPRLVNSTNTMRIGNGYIVGGGGITDIHHCSLFNRGLPLADVQTQYAAVKARAARKYSAITF
jgi:hypothetical protein